LKLSGKKINFSKVVVNGAGAAGLGIAELLAAAGVKEVYALDSKGLIYKGRKEGMNQFKEALAEYTNKKRISGHVNDVIEGAGYLHIGSAILQVRQIIHRKDGREACSIRALQSDAGDIICRSEESWGVYRCDRQKR
jgi:Malic enzyme